MSQATHPAAHVASPYRARLNAIGFGLLGLIAAALVAAALALGGPDTYTAGSAVSPQPATRSDGGPSESAVAASVASRPSAGPSESAIAAAIGTADGAATANESPNESRIAAAISQSPSGRR